MANVGKRKLGILQAKVNLAEGVRVTSFVRKVEPVAIFCVVK